MKTYHYLFAIMVAMMAITVFNSCSDDSDNSSGNGKASTSMGVLDKKTGLRIKSVGSYTINYDEDGRIGYISDGQYSKFVFSYNPNKITEVYSYGNTEEEEMSYSVGYNGNGYITSLSTSYSWSEDEGKGTINEDAKFSYDGGGHLTKVSASGKNTWKQEREQYSRSYTFTTTVTLSWKNDKLMSITWHEKMNESDGDVEEWVDTQTLEYDNECYPNVYNQWTNGMAKMLSDEMEMLAYVGLLGKGSEYLPDYCNIRDRESERTYSLYYDLNSDGSIRSATINKVNQYFTYEYAKAASETYRTKKYAPVGQNPSHRRQSFLFRRNSSNYHR